MQPARVRPRYCAACGRCSDLGTGPLQGTYRSRVKVMAFAAANSLTMARPPVIWSATLDTAVALASLLAFAS